MLWKQRILGRRGKLSTLSFGGSFDVNSDFC